MITVDADIPGGNIRVLAIDGDELHLAQDLRDTVGHWFWWHCRVRGAAGRRLMIHLGDDHLLTSAGPAVSVDGGAQWQWGLAEEVGTHGFSLPVPPDCQDLRLAMSIPYTEAVWRQALAALPSSGLEEHLLCHSRKGRPVHWYRLGAQNPSCRVLLTARNHACEAMADYVLDGFLAAALRAGDAAAGWLREQVELWLVPFMDRDGVEDGDQGKNRAPHDHNRDYGDAAEPAHHPEVQALKNLVRAHEGDGVPLQMSLDLHCPWIRYGQNETVFLVGAEEPSDAAAQLHLLADWVDQQQGPLHMYGNEFCPWGQDWNTASGPPTSCSRWLRARPGMRLATTIEVSYAVHHDQLITVEAARALGADLLRASVAVLRR